MKFFKQNYAVAKPKFFRCQRRCYGRYLHITESLKSD
jgi:hypothetical protein